MQRRDWIASLAGLFLALCPKTITATKSGSFKAFMDTINDDSPTSDTEIISANFEYMFGAAAMAFAAFLY